MGILENTGTPATQVDVQIIMSDVRRRVRAETQREAGALRRARKFLPAGLAARVSRLQARMSGLRTSVARICDLPAAPPTLRGRLGGVAVRIMRRSLFWLLPNLQATQEQLVAAVEEQTQALEELVRALEKTNARIELLAAAQESGGAASDLNGNA